MLTILSIQSVAPCHLFIVKYSTYVCLFKLRKMRRMILSGINIAIITVSIRNHQFCVVRVFLLISLAWICIHCTMTTMYFPIVEMPKQFPIQFSCTLHGTNHWIWLHKKKRKKNNNQPLWIYRIHGHVTHREWGTETKLERHMNRSIRIEWQNAKSLHVYNFNRNYLLH